MAATRLDRRKLDKASMDYERLSPFPESEARFLQRGYVATDGGLLEQAANWRSQPAFERACALARGLKDDGSHHGKADVAPG